MGLRVKIRVRIGVMWYSRIRVRVGFGARGYGMG